MSSLEERLTTLEQSFYQSRADAVKSYQDMAMQVTLFRGLTETIIGRLATVQYQMEQHFSTLTSTVQTQIEQRFSAFELKIQDQVEQRFDAFELAMQRQAEQRFDGFESTMQKQMEQRFKAFGFEVQKQIGQRFDVLDLMGGRLTTVEHDASQIKEALTGHTALLTAILERLPEKSS
jgi:hypothetical protein